MKPTRASGGLSPAAAVLGASTGILAIGVLAFLSEHSAWLKQALTLSAAIGPLSGKALFGYLIAALVFVVASKTMGRKGRSPTRFLWLAVALTIVSSALILLPALLLG